MASEPNGELEFLTYNFLESQIRKAEKSRIGVIHKLLLYVDHSKIQCKFHRK